ncbi:hypothetical protein Poli38472_000058 [Pythium oligandrum]|uniref:Uncharacterized protein n=1 Tax=Pythium oligandrum TaxID=41045 RepID=A0A8K1FF04_PYTOL|nr:hypothetical protein Poli38472_000058 [Pythium oligandrum]|eukprot:TMW60016.1 hypothetical protein Poli38472_000058 [Pythium oligandrum]
MEQAVVAVTGGADVMAAPAPPSHATAFQRAGPLTERILECLKFLHRVERVVISDVVDGEFVLDVYLNDSEDTSKPACSTRHGFKAVQELHNVCVHWSKKHIYLDPRYGVEPCKYCAAFNADEKINSWPSGLSKLLSSTKSMKETLEPRINEYVQGARAEKGGDLVCEGIEHIPSVVARFLLKNVDTATL